MNERKPWAETPPPPTDQMTVTVEAKLVWAGGPDCAIGAMVNFVAAALGRWLPDHIAQFTAMTVQAKVNRDSTIPDGETLGEYDLLLDVKGSYAPLTPEEAAAIIASRQMHDAQNAATSPSRQ